MRTVIAQQLKTLPKQPGVYLFKNRFGNVLYVGKAKVLQQRVRSYFRAQTDLSDLKLLMIPQIDVIDTIPVATETDAIVLEDQLIKDYQPRFNTLAKDDKSFLYIHITAETTPRILAVRRPDLASGGIFYGPYPYAKNIRSLLLLIHKIFPDTQQIDRVIALLEGKLSNLIPDLQTAMQQAARQKHFERAAHLRDQIRAVQQLKMLRKTPRQYLLERMQTTSLDIMIGLKELSHALHLPESLHRIEVYDISHHQGRYMVGSMIVFIDGLPDKAEYRRFKIKSVLTGQSDDFKSLREVVQRRLKRDWSLPDLAIMDGGKGQLSAVAPLWQLAGVPVAALAKKREELFLPGIPLPVLLSAGSQGLFLVQRMRDEAHRFAISYYRLLHSRAMRQAGK
ncbi:MAG: UvrB/UvrC motif-containing protein [Patescibacteria group bacterium]|jgi:excinuclease ABC subunit C